MDQGWKRQGRPKMNWMEGGKQDINKLGLHEHLSDITLDRRERKGSIMVSDKLLVHVAYPINGIKSSIVVLVLSTFKTIKEKGCPLSCFF